MCNDTEIEIKGMIESSFLDWDGKVVTTLYLPNCNFRCPFCHNWELTDTPEKFNTVSMAEIDRHLLRNRDFIDGICITGGEPTLYSSLPEFIDHFREMGFMVKLDTNGSDPNVLEQLIDETKLDYIAMDIKGPFDERYDKVAGVKVDMDRIKRSVRIITESSVDYEFRTTVVPTLLGTGDLEDIANDLSGAKRFVCQQFVADHARAKSLQNVKPYSIEILKEIQTQFKTKIKNVLIRGVK